MLKKLMIRTWFGDLPPWTEEFVEHVQHLKAYGWDFMLVCDPVLFRQLCKQNLGVEPAIIPGSRKAGDFDPYLADIFPGAIEDYDFWGHYNLDAVYGRLDRWLPDSFLQNVDVFANDPGQICGPFTLYRNVRRVNELYRGVETWRENLADPCFRGWDELDFSKEVVHQSLKGYVTFASGFFQAHDHMTDTHKALRKVRIKKDGSLIDGCTGREIMMYHFNQSREWPVCK